MTSPTNAHRWPKRYRRLHEQLAGPASYFLLLHLDLERGSALELSGDDQQAQLRDPEHNMEPQPIPYRPAARWARFKLAMERAEPQHTDRITVNGLSLMALRQNGRPDVEALLPLPELRLEEDAR